MIYHHHVESSALSDDSVRAGPHLLQVGSLSSRSKSRAERPFLKDPEQTRLFYERLIVRH